MYADLLFVKVVYNYNDLIIPNIDEHNLSTTELNQNSGTAPSEFDNDMIDDDFSDNDSCNSSASGESLSSF